MHGKPFIGISVLLLVLCMIGGTLTGCRSEKEPIRIGLAVNLSGTGGAAGEHIRDGALLAVDEINGQGGINGRPVELLVKDDRNSDEGIKEADNALIDAGVLAVIGHSYSSNTITAHPLVIGRNTILITAYTATTKLTGLDDLFLRTSVDCAQYGRKMAHLLTAKGARRVSVLLDMSNADFVVDYMVHTQRNFAGELFQVPFNSKQDVDWPHMIEGLTAPGPDSIILLTEASMTGIALQKLDQAGFTGNRIATLWTQTPELLRLAGCAAEGLSIVTYIDPENRRPEFQAFDRNMRKKFNKPATARSTRAHEMVSILVDALRRCKTLTVDELKKALLAGHYGTIMGSVAFDPFGDVVRPIYEVTVKDGSFRNRGEIP